MVIAEAVRRSGIDPAIVDECIMGNVVTAGLGQNPARQAALRSGLSDHVAALTINMVCGSGLRAVMLGAQGIAAGDIDIVVAGGMESMSNCPYMLPRVREGLRMGSGEMLDSMITDGLWCAFEQCHGTPRSRREHYRSAARRRTIAARSHQRRSRPRGRWFKGELAVRFPAEGPPTYSIETAIARATSNDWPDHAAFKKEGSVTAERTGVKNGARPSCEGATARARGSGADVADRGACNERLARIILMTRSSHSQRRAEGRWNLQESTFRDQRGIAVQAARSERPALTTARELNGGAVGLGTHGSSGRAC